MRKKIMLMSPSLDPRLLCAVEAAKKLADSEGAEVYCDGKCVYYTASEQ